MSESPFNTTANRYSVNEHFFDHPEEWTEEQSYWFGWMVADGHNLANGKGISIKLAESDGYILDELKSMIKYTGPLLTVKRTEVNSINGNKISSYQDRRCLTIYNKNLSNSLKNLGVVSGKSTSLILPAINSETFHHFVRALFDGDGCFTFSKYNHFESSLLGAEDMLQSIQKWLSIFGVTSVFNRKIVYGNGTRILRISGNNNGMRLYLCLYRDFKYSLKRKISAFEKVKIWKGNSCLKKKEVELFNEFACIFNTQNETQNPITD